MAISWYPGHMHKARKELRALLRGAKLAIEVLDARIPAASSNPLLASMRQGLPTIRILNKTDLADPAATCAWRQHFARERGGGCLTHGRDKPIDRHALPALAAQLAGSSAAAAPKPGEIAIIGIPNVGKSSLLNHCIGRKLARTGNVPSVTRSQQAVRLAAGWRLVDTPGMLSPRLSDQRAALLMASVGSIGAAAIDELEVAEFLAQLLLQRHPERLAERYRLEATDITCEDFFASIAAVRGALRSAGRADLGKAAEMLLHDFRAARLGRITLEHLPDDDSGQADDP